MITNLSKIKVDFSSKKIIPICISALVIFSFCAANIQTPILYSLTNQTYTQKKGEVKTKITEIDQKLNEAQVHLEDFDQKSENLEEEIARRQKRIDDANNLITESKLLINKIDQQIEENGKQISSLTEQMRTLLKEIQKQNKVSPIQSLLSSENLGEALGKVYTLSTLQSKADEVKNKLEEANQELLDNKQKQEEMLKGLEASNALLKSERDSLSELKEKYEGKTEEYTRDIKNLKELNKTAEAQLIALDKEWSEKIANEKKAAEAVRIANEKNKAATTPSKTSGSPTTATRTSATVTGSRPTGGPRCWFEDSDSMNVRLAKPTSGYVSQNFHCRHDGVDIANSIGTEILSVAPGSIVEKGYHASGYGNFVVVKHSTGGETFYSLYAHMKSQSPLKIGTGVGQGQVIGYMGSTGYSTGSHVHMSILSDSFTSTRNVGCRNGGSGGSKCYRPENYINF